MKKSLLALTVASALLGTSGAAMAGGEDPGAAIIGVKGFWIDPDNERFLDDGIGYQLSFGKVLSEQWNFNLGFFSSTHERNDSLRSDVEMYGFGLDWERHFKRDEKVNPFLLIGFGYQDGDNPGGNDRSTADSMFANVGGGLIGDLATFDNGNKLQLRADLGARYFVGQSLVDPYVGLGLQVAFGGNPPPAPVVAAPPPPPPPPAPPPPPPPPPPPADDDQDGVVNGTDLCPTTPAGDRVDAVGCSLTARLEVLFQTDSSEILPESHSQLDAAVKFMKDVPAAKGDIEGHTDSVGTDAYNLKLSQRRAESVVQYLVGKGVASERLTPRGFGESMPVADNATADGRALNRRVVLQRTDVR